MESHARFFAKLVHQYDAKLTNFAQSYVKNYLVAEEIVSDVFYKLWEKKASLKQIENMESYLYVSTKNHCLNYIQSKSGKLDLRTDHPNSLDFLIENFDPEAALITKELEAFLDKTIDALPHSCKAVFQLVKGKGMRHQQAAEVLGISPKTVENQIAKAVKRLRAAMDVYNKQQHGEGRDGSMAISISWGVLPILLQLLLK